MKKKHHILKRANAITVSHLNGYANMINKVKILHDINFVVPKGAVCAFIGHNGAGKTTTIKSMLGLRKNFNGDIYLMNKHIKNVSSRKNVTYIPDRLNNEPTKAIHFLRMNGRILGLSKSVIDKRIKTLAHIFHLPLHSLRIKMNRLSAGQNKMVLLIQAFLGNPKIVIADEPTDNLDPRTRDIFGQYVKEYHKKHPRATFFISSHNLEEIAKYTTYAVFLHEGRMMLQMPCSKGFDLTNRYRGLRKQGERKFNRMRKL